METVHHVHADDVAQAFCRALEHPGAAAGESFHVVSPAAVTLRGFAERTARWFGHEAALSWLAWDEWKKTVPPADAAATWDHIAHSPNCSIEKARRLIGYEPRYSSLDAVFESIGWLADRGWNAGGPPERGMLKGYLSRLPSRTVLPFPVSSGPARSTEYSPALPFHW